MGRAVILGGAGQIGIAVAQALVARGWDVILVGRSPSPPGPWIFQPADRDAAGAVEAVVGAGADLLLDCIAFDGRHADQLCRVAGDVRHIVAISSASVYADPEGRTLDEAAETGFPVFPVPIPEDHPVVAPGPETYSTRKVAMERQLLEGAPNATVLRPCAIHGPHSKHAREWWVIKRLLDGRKVIPLAYQGQSRFQTTSTRAIGEAVLRALGGTAPRVLNVADADAPTVSRIARTIMQTLGREAELVGLPDAPYPPGVGGTPWSVARPMICATSLPRARTYAETAPAAIEWIVRASEGRDWRAVFPQLAAYPKDLFDYAAEDTVLARAAGGAP